MDKLLKRLDEFNRQTEFRLGPDKVKAIVESMDKIIREADEFLKLVEKDDTYSTFQRIPNGGSPIIAESESFATVDFNRQTTIKQD
jgi:hypothetical protein